MSISTMSWGAGLFCLWNSCQATSPGLPAVPAVPCPAPPADPETAIIQQNLSRHVHTLAGEIGERNLAAYAGLNRAADYALAQMSGNGLQTRTQEYRVRPGLLRRKWAATGYGGQTYRNLVGEIRGTSRPDEIVVVGAHYDSVAIKGCHGANDNASGVAATLELARAFAGRPQARTLRFVAFANEEPPFFWSAGMGSYVYAKECRAKNEKIVAMLTPETIGYYSDLPGSQHYPLPFFSWFHPRTGNFVAWVANDAGSKALHRRCLKVFQEHSTFPADGAVVPRWIPHAASSDHWAFAKVGYPALMITDTAMYRYRYYHTIHDDPDQLDYAKMAQVVTGLRAVVADLANPAADPTMKR